MEPKCHPITSILEVWAQSPQALGFAINYEMFGQTFSTGLTLSVFNMKPTTKCWVSVQGMAFRLIRRIAVHTADGNPPAEGPSGTLQFQNNFVEPLSFFFFFFRNTFPFTVYDNPLILPINLKLPGNSFLFFFFEGSEQSLLFVMDSELCIKNVHP